jgi:hypothetical protein
MNTSNLETNTARIERLEAENARLAAALLNRNEWICRLCAELRKVWAYGSVSYNLITNAESVANQEDISGALASLLATTIELLKDAKIRLANFYICPHPFVVRVESEIARLTALTKGDK